MGEAVAPGPGQSDDRVPSMPRTGVVHGTHEYRFLLRYSQALLGKLRSLDRWQALVKPDDPCVVAISGLGIGRAEYEDHAPGEHPMIVRMLFGVGEIQLHIPFGTDAEPSVEYPERFVVARRTVHNPIATNPLPRGFLPGIDVYVDEDGIVQPRVDQRSGSRMEGVAVR